MDEFSVRDELERIIKESNINKNEFHEAGKTQWLEILHKTEESFLQKKHYTNTLDWGWVLFKEPWFSLSFINDNAYEYIPKLIEEESVWFIVEDYKDKMWVYEVDKAIISNIIAECSFLREYFLVSKKYEWILCENHHGVLYGSGNKIVNNMKNFRKQYSEKVY